MPDPAGNHLIVFLAEALLCNSLCTICNGWSKVPGFKFQIRSKINSNVSPLSRTIAAGKL